jgi:hypothetical protein
VETVSKLLSKKGKPNGRIEMINKMEKLCVIL